MPGLSGIMKKIDVITHKKAKVHVGFRPYHDGQHSAQIIVGWIDPSEAERFLRRRVKPNQESLMCM